MGGPLSAVGAAAIPDNIFHTATEFFLVLPDMEPPPWLHYPESEWAASAIESPSSNGAVMHPSRPAAPWCVCVGRIQQTFGPLFQGGVPVAVPDSLPTAQQKGQGMGRPSALLQGCSLQSGRGPGDPYHHAISRQLVPESGVGRGIQPIEHG